MCRDGEAGCVLPWSPRTAPFPAWRTPASVPAPVFTLAGPDSETPAVLPGTPPVSVSHFAGFPSSKNLAPFPLSRTSLIGLCLLPGTGLPGRAWGSRLWPP